MTENSTILRDTVSSNRANNKIKFIVGGVIVIALVAYLIVSSISSASAYYREVGEVLAQRTELTGKPLRVSGTVVVESIDYDAANLDLNFRISDPADATKQLAVHFHGVEPDQIGREGTGAIVEGTLRSDGVVEANNLLLKCPSKYEQSQETQVQAVQ